MPDVRLILGDCLDKMAGIAPGSVDMVLCDPPYGTAGGMGKGEARYSRIAAVEWDNAIDPAVFLPKCNDALRMNGAMVLFAQEPYTSRLVTQAHPNLPFSYRLLWLKDHFSNSLLVNAAPVSYFEDMVVCFKKYDTLGQHPLRAYTERLFAWIGKSKKELFAEMGHQGVCHFMRSDSMQFTLCTRKTYDELCSLYGIDRLDWFMPYDRLEEIGRRFNRRFNLPLGQKFKSNVLHYRKDYGGFHPTQKPVALLEDLIRTYTNEGDTVLDFTMGSGSTGVAAVNTGRAFIGIERDATYFATAQRRIAEAQSQPMLLAAE